MCVPNDVTYVIIVNYRYKGRRRKTSAASYVWQSGCKKGLHDTNSSCGTSTWFPLTQKAIFTSLSFLSTIPQIWVALSKIISLKDHSQNVQSGFHTFTSFDRSCCLSSGKATTVWFLERLIKIGSGSYYTHYLLLGFSINIEVL